MENELIEYIKKELLNGDESIELTPEDDLLNSGLIDSIGTMRLVAYIEETNSIKVAPEHMIIDNFISVTAISSYIKNRKESH